MSICLMRSFARSVIEYGFDVFLTEWLPDTV